MRNLRRVVRAAAAIVVVAVGLALTPAPAWAMEDPPDVTGLPVVDATAKLAAWNKAVFFQYEPAPDLDLGVDATDVLVARIEWPQGTPSSVGARPIARLYLGRRVPDLGGLTVDRARDEARFFAFRVLATPVGAGPDWIVDTQTPVPGLIVEFVNGPRVIDVVLTAPVAPTPTVAPIPQPPPPPGLSTVELVVLGGSGLAGAALLLLVGLALRRALRRSGTGTRESSGTGAREHSEARARERSEADPVERIEVRAHAGETVGPVLVERTGR